MQAPQSFLNRLRDEFGGRLRLRWAPTQGEWHLEQRVGRGIFDPPLPSHRVAPHQRAIQFEKRERARDGFSFVMAVRPGDRMPCPACGSTLKVPVMEMRETICTACAAKGRDSHVMAAFYPLGEVLLDHLRKIDPERDGVRRQARDIDLANDARQASLARAADGALHDGLIDAAMEQFPRVGYTGKEFV
jgi:hypothetical protein